MERFGVSEVTFHRASREEGTELAARPSWVLWYFLSRIFTAFCFVFKVLLLGLWNCLTLPQCRSREVGWASCRAHLIHEKRNIRGDETISPGFHSQEKIGIWNWNSDSYTENLFCYTIEEMLKCSLNRERGKRNGYREKEGGGLGREGERKARGMA